ETLFCTIFKIISCLDDGRPSALSSRFVDSKRRPLSLYLSWLAHTRDRRRVHHRSCTIAQRREYPLPHARARTVGSRDQIADREISADERRAARRVSSDRGTAPTHTLWPCVPRTIRGALPAR